MATIEMTEPNVATPETVPAGRHRYQLVLWRIGIVLFLAVLGFLWVQSWSRIHHRYIPVGTSGIDCILAGASAAVSFTASPFQIVDFGESLGPPDSSHLVHYDARWIDGDAFGRVSNSCLFAPEVDSVIQPDLDRMGSFGANLATVPSPAGPETFLHLRLPLWFFTAVSIGGWVWLERSVRHRRRAAGFDR